MLALAVAFPDWAILNTQVAVNTKQAFLVMCCVAVEMDLLSMACAAKFLCPRCTDFGCMGAVAPYAGQVFRSV